MCGLTGSWVGGRLRFEGRSWKSRGPFITHLPLLASSQELVLAEKLSGQRGVPGPSTRPSCSNNTGVRGEAAEPPADGEGWTHGRLGPKGVPGVGVGGRAPGLRSPFCWGLSFLKGNCSSNFLTSHVSHLNIRNFCYVLTTLQT